MKPWRGDVPTVDELVPLLDVLDADYLTGHRKSTSPVVIKLVAATTSTRCGVLWMPPRLRRWSTGSGKGCPSWWAVERCNQTQGGAVICSECGEVALAVGLCPRHYSQQRRGTLAPDGPTVGSPSGFGRYGVIDRDEDSILCHECGKRLAALGYHIRRVHDMWFPPNRGGLSYAAARSGAVLFS